MAQVQSYYNLFIWLLNCSIELQLYLPKTVTISDSYRVGQMASPQPEGDTRDHTQVIRHTCSPSYGTV